MPSHRHRAPPRLAVGSVLLLWAVVGPWLGAAQPDYVAKPAFPAVLARAGQEKLPTSGIDPATDTAALRPDDFVTVLVTLAEGSSQQQWLAEFRVADPLPSEKESPTAAAATVYTNTGRTFEFTSRTATLRLRMFGPYRPETPVGDPRERSARLVVKTDFLGAGFDHYCAISLRAHEAGFDFPYLLAGSPFPAERVAKDAATVQAGGITLADEKAIAATGPALNEFLGIARHTPGLKELVVKISDLPPLTGWITGGSTGFFFEPPGMARLDGAPWGLPGTTVYRAPFKYFLKGAPVMKGTLFFAAPKPPLLTCAGILALTIESPKHPEKTLELRVLAARRQAE